MHSQACAVRARVRQGHGLSVSSWDVPTQGPLGGAGTKYLNKEFYGVSGLKSVTLIDILLFNSKYQS